MGLKALDTNILARYVANDDPAQAELAGALLNAPCFVSDSVLLETAWLLSSRYQMKRGPLAATLLDLLSLPQLNVRDPAGTAWAIERFAAGADFADMMHVIASHGADAFATFDRAIAEAAGNSAPVPVETHS